jgi:pimeloyl-ACP methyl ester carboxylesterase
MSTSIDNTTLLPLKTIKVPHLRGIGISYSLPNGPIKSSKPTLIFINGYSGNAHRFRAQVDDPQLTAVANLLVLEPLGHGGTNTSAPAFTLWDAAWAFSQALDALNVQKYMVCGTSMGGFIAARMALYTPERVSSSAAKIK